jgi:hypothetical protein
MKTAFAVIGIALLAATFAERPAPAVAAELRVGHRHVFWRIWPQDCFLTPDMAVELDALGPYCSSPRGHYHRTAWRFSLR